MPCVLLIYLSPGLRPVLLTASETSAMTHPVSPGTEVTLIPKFSVTVSFLFVEDSDGASTIAVTRS